MAGFFGLFDYTKEGRGVYPDDPEKGPFATFFAIFGRKFWKIVTINLMYLLFSLPALLVAFIAAPYVTKFMFNLEPEQLMGAFLDMVESYGLVLQEGISKEAFASSQMVLIFLIIALALVGLSLFVLGPVHAGVTYLLRNYSREEHAFVWMDFKEHAAKNMKQSLISSLISLGVVMLLLFIFWFYANFGILGSSILQVFFQTTIAVVLFFWCSIQIYLYPMMVTFDMPLKQMYKNSLLLSIIRLPINVFILLLSLIITLILPLVLMFIPYGITFLLAFLWYTCLAFGLNLLMTNFVAYRAIDKYMISRLRAAEEMNEADEGSENSAAGEEAENKDGWQENEKAGLPNSPK